jgi:hypothetical protein
LRETRIDADNRLSFVMAAVETADGFVWDASARWTVFEETAASFDDVFCR